MGRSPARPAFLLALALYLALTAWIAWRSAVLAPYADMFDWVDRWYRYRQDGDLAGYLFAPHNLHRIAWTFGILDLDIRLFGAGGYLFVAGGLLALAAAAVLLAREAWGAAPSLGPAGAALAAMLALMPGGVLDAVIPINGSYVYCLAFAVAAIGLAQPQDSGARLGWRDFAVLALVAAAAFGNAVGLALWPVLAFSAWRSRGDRRWLALVVAAGVLFIWGYAAGQELPGGAGHLDPLASAQLALSFLGLPWTRAAPALGWLLGLALLAAALVALVRKGGPAAPRSERVAVALILFSLGAALMAGLGRTGATALADAPLRYAVFVTPLHVGLLILALPAVVRLREARPRQVDAALVAVAVLALGHQAVMGAAAIRTTDVNRRLIADFVAGRETPAMTLTIHPDLARARALSERMRRDGLYQGR